MLGWKIIQLVLAVWEILIGLHIVRYTVVGEDDVGKTTKIVGVLFGIVLGALLVVNRTWSVVSWIMVIFNIVITFVLCAIMIRKHFIMLFAMIWAYYSIISILEIFFCFVYMLILQDAFFTRVYTNTFSVLRELIYLLSCSIMTMIAYGIKRLMKNVNINVFDYKPSELG